MHCAQKMTHNIYWIGSNDWTTERFENLFPIPNGVSYNSYFIDDEKTCVVDSVDAEIREEYFDNLSHLLNGRDLDYIIVNHMEPDHCQTLLETLERYPNCKMVGNATTFRMFEQFYRTPKPDQYYTVKEGDEICLGKHTLVSYTMPMVHWPEVTCTYEKSTGTLFSADAFGTFGTINGNIFADQTDFVATYEDEARRYYTNIVGKYGPQVQNAIRKVSGLKLNALLHFMVQSGVHLKRLTISCTNICTGPATQLRKKALLSPLVPCMATLVTSLNNWLNNCLNAVLQILKSMTFPKQMRPTSSLMLGNIQTW